MRGTRFSPALPLLAAALFSSACAESTDHLERAAPLQRTAASFLAEEAAAQPARAPEPPPPPRAPREEAPPIIRGVYVSSYAFATPAKRSALLALAESTEVNAFVVDVKDDDGIRYVSADPLAREVSRGTIPLKDLKAVVDTLVAHGIHPIARVVVFKDRYLAPARPEWAIRTPEGELWIDKAGNRWMSPWDERVWDYNVRVAEEAARAGFREIQFDYVRFPEAYRSLPRQVHARERGERADAIAGFLAEARRRLHPLGVTVTADLFGLSMNEAADVGIGQQWERLSAIADHLLPMVYPSHYFPTHLPGIRTPNRLPYETVFTSVGMGVIRNRRVREAGHTPARIVPWIQGFSMGHRYGPEEARAQMRAIYELGLEDWIFWNAASKYDAIAPALEPETAPRALAFDPPQRLESMVDRFDREGAADARARLSRDEAPLAGEN
ncbi:MAG TPA: putative glycoside hydrolase [Longimicrobiaceae bacterium]|nr:putative glycoside hydrolase [Longimicrobiaceae bacterium]